MTVSPATLVRTARWAPALLALGLLLPFAARAQYCEQVCDVSVACGTSCLAEEEYCSQPWQTDYGTYDAEAGAYEQSCATPYTATWWTTCEQYDPKECAMGSGVMGSYAVGGSVSASSTGGADKIDVTNAVCQPATRPALDTRRYNKDLGNSLISAKFFLDHESKLTSRSLWAKVMAGAKVKVKGRPELEVVRGEAEFSANWKTKSYNVQFPARIYVFGQLVYGEVAEEITKTAKGPDTKASLADKLKKILRGQTPQREVFTTSIYGVSIRVLVNFDYGLEWEMANAEIKADNGDVIGFLLDAGPAYGVNAKATAEASVGIAAVGIDGVLSLFSVGVGTRVYVYLDPDNWRQWRDAKVRWYRDIYLEGRWLSGKLVGWVRVLGTTRRKDLLSWNGQSVFTEQLGTTGGCVDVNNACDTPSCGGVGCGLNDGCGGQCQPGSGCVNSCELGRAVGPNNLNAYYAGLYDYYCAYYYRHGNGYDYNGYCTAASNYAAAANLRTVGTGNCTGGLQANLNAATYAYYCRYYEYYGYGSNYGGYCDLAEDYAKAGGCTECKPGGQVICTPTCSGKVCGAANGCGGTCQAGSGCCQPSCSGKVCGSANGCGGTCQAGSGCCQPSCSGQVCGNSDGCGGTCVEGSGCTPPQQGDNHDPIGWLDAVATGGWAYGWTCDRDSPNTSIEVHFWDCNWQYFLGSTVANEWSEQAIANECYGGSAHRFGLGLAAHGNGMCIGAWGIDTVDGIGLLGNSGRTFSW